MVNKLDIINEMGSIMSCLWIIMFRKYFNIMQYNEMWYNSGDHNVLPFLPYYSNRVQLTVQSKHWCAVSELCGGLSTQYMMNQAVLIDTVSRVWSCAKICVVDALWV